VNEIYASKHHHHHLGVSYELERQSMAYFIKEKTAEVTIKKCFNLEIDLANKLISEGKRDLDLKKKMVRIVYIY
jgi:isopenicillin N synthase-like dioxygenase